MNFLLAFEQSPPNDFFKPCGRARRFGDFGPPPCMRNGSFWAREKRGSQFRIGENHQKSAKINKNRQKSTKICVFQHFSRTPKKRVSASTKRRIVEVIPAASHGPDLHPEETCFATLYVPHEHLTGLKVVVMCSLDKFRHEP